jgi:probable phosphoglycerate mutase
LSSRPVLSGVVRCLRYLLFISLRVAVSLKDPIRMEDPRMTGPMPEAWLIRHGETEWSRDGRHTGRTDVPLTAAGERAALRLRTLVEGIAFAQVLTSPLQRALRTCALAGFAAPALADADLVEWDYGDYEGRRSPDILRERPDWSLFRDGCPHGESPAEVAARADRVVRRVRSAAGATLIFSSGHLLRVLAARWLGLGAEAGRCLALSTASLSVLGDEHGGRDPVILRWNQQAMADGTGPAGG